MKNKASNRRNFLKTLGLVAAGVTATPLSVKASPAEETVKMLTPDGKLVEVSKRITEKAPRQKVNAKEILQWRTLKG